RYDYASAVLRNGKVFIVGGEYATAPGGVPGELYDPQNNSWSLAASPPSSIWNYGAGGDGFSDAFSMTLPNGRIIIEPVVFHSFNGTLIYDPDTDSWSAGPSSNGYQNEASWVKLADNSILTIPRNSSVITERYIPSLNQWILDANINLTLYGAGS